MFELTMNMLSRLRYLLSEGFEVASLSVYDGSVETDNAGIVYIVPDKRGGRRLVSEEFEASPEEIMQCSRIFLSTLSKREE